MCTNICAYNDRINIKKKKLIFLLLLSLFFFSFFSLIIMSVSSPKTAVDKTKDNTDEKKSVDESPTQDYIRVALLTSLALYLRIMILGYPHFITEIELEATRQVNWYMSGKFFIGKFPPLMGLLSAGLARTVGYYGTEDLLYAGQ